MAVEYFEYLLSVSSLYSRCEIAQTPSIMATAEMVAAIECSVPVTEISIHPGSNGKNATITKLAPASATRAGPIFEPSSIPLWRAKASYHQKTHKHEPSIHHECIGGSSLSELAHRLRYMAVAWSYNPNPKNNQCVQDRGSDTRKGEQGVDILSHTGILAWSL